MNQSKKIIWFESYFPVLLKKPYKSAIAEIKNLYIKAGQNFEDLGIALFAEGLLNRFSNKFDKAFSFYKKAMKCFINTGSLEWIAALEHGIGHLYDLQGKLNQAEKYYLLALNFYNKNKIIKREAMICVNLGRLYSERADYANSLKFYNRAYKLFILLKDLHSQAVTMNNIASVYKSDKEYDKAIKLYKESTKIFIKLKDKEKIAGNYTNIGSIYFLLKKLNESEKYLLKSLEYADKLKPNYIYANALLNMASILIDKRNYQEAFKYLKDAQVISEAIKDNFQIAKSEIALGDYYYSIKNYSDAKKHYILALKLVKSYNYLNEGIMLLLKLSETSEKVKNYRESLRYYKHYHKIYIDIYNKNAAEKIANLKSTFEKEKAEKESEILRLRNLELKREIEIETKELNQAANYIVRKNDFIDSLLREIKSYVKLNFGVGININKFNEYLYKVERRKQLNEDIIHFENNLNKINLAFLDKLAKKYPELTRIELKICSLMKINLCTKEIAKLLSVSHRTIETHCHHIIQKLHLPKGKRLSVFINTI